MRFVLLAIFAVFISHSGFAADATIPKAKFTDEFKKKLPEIFCDEKTYFRKCFDLAADKCIKSVSDATAACITGLDKDIPALLRQPGDGGAWGEKIGSCAGNKFELEHAKLKKAAADCKDPVKWK